TAADARTHFGIFAPQVWKLFPRGQTIHVSFWDYNDVAPGYFAAAEIAAREQNVGVISIEVARPDFKVADRTKFADTDIRAAAKGLYVIRDFTPGQPRHGYVVAQGSSATFNLVSILPRLEQAGINVKVIAAISEELFDRQPSAYQHAVLPTEAKQDLMFVMSGTRRMWPLRNVGPLADDYSLTADWDNQWLTGGLEADVIAEAHLDAESIFKGVTRFAHDRPKRLEEQRRLLKALGEVTKSRPRPRDRERAASPSRLLAEGELGWRQTTRSVNLGTPGSWWRCCSWAPRWRPEHRGRLDCWSSRGRRNSGGTGRLSA